MSGGVVRGLSIHQVRTTCLPIGVLAALLAVLVLLLRDMARSMDEVM